jgi:hypothetical protein
MVSYSLQARKDLNDLMSGLLDWRKIILTEEFVMSYIDDIIDICDSLDTQLYHANTVYPLHKHYGSKVYKYKRNPNTTWYIIYNLDRYGNVFVRKIISNYLTI